jgi:hypothetical protein
LLGRSPTGQPLKWPQRHKAFSAALEKLDDLTSAQRVNLFAAFFPQLGRHIEAGWQLRGRLPYELDSTRKAFRAPNTPEVLRPARTSWFSSLLSELSNYDPDITWCAAWAPHLSHGYGADSLGVLLAAAIDAGGEEGEAVFQILRDSATNDHEIGHMGRHVTRALLTASRPDGWEFVEKLLLAAQRQEGLRQVILESIDEAHPQAFRRMLRLILDQNLIRFSATVRAVDVWFGLQWDSATPGTIKKALEQTLKFLEDPAARDEAIRTARDESVDLALWAIAFDDAAAAVAPAAGLLTDPVVERRFLGVKFLEQLELPAARKELVRSLDDADLRIALRSFEAITGQGGVEGVDLFEVIKKLLPRMPEKPAELDALVWPWATTGANRQNMAAFLIHHLGKRKPTVLIPYLADFNSYGRMQLVMKLGEVKNPTGEVRDTLFALVGDRDAWVRNRAVEAVKKCDVGEDEALRIEGFLTRKGSSMRQGVLALLKKQKIALAIASVDRLLASKKTEQRIGGLELMRLLVESKKGINDCRQRAEQYREKRPSLTEEEQDHLDVILNIHREVPTLDNALGLMDPTQRTPPVPPRPARVMMLTPAAIACLKALDDLITANAETTVVLGQGGQEGGLAEHLFGNLRSWQIPNPDLDLSPAEDAAHLPLRQVWEDWYANRPKKQQDRDGLELLRAMIWCEMTPREWKDRTKKFKRWKDYLDFARGDVELVELKHADMVQEILEWMIRLHPPEKPFDFLLDVVETSCALVPKADLSAVYNLENWQQRDKDWRNTSPLVLEPDGLGRFRWLMPGAFTAEQRLRLWRLLHWRDEPVPGVARFRPGLDHLLDGFLAGEANETDIYDQLLGPHHDSFSDLGQLTIPNNSHVERAPALAPLVDRIRQRILEIELKRGETPTAATQPSQALNYIPGMETLFQLLARLDRKNFARSVYGSGRVETMTRLILRTYPTAQDTPEAFAAAVKKADLSRERLLALAFMAPQWLPHVRHTLGWDGLEEGVYWFLAHMPGGGSGVNPYPPQEVRAPETGGEPKPPSAEEVTAALEDEEATGNAWDRLIRERTPLTDEERREGGVDVTWFHRVYAPLGRKRWDALAEASKFGCNDRSYARARLLAEVLLGRAKKRDLIHGVREGKLKESVRLLGLLPLPTGDQRDAELHTRYRVLQEYRRYARSLGPMSREGALRAATIGMENLARTAGYPDPIRLEWAMEAREIADLAAGPIAVTHQGVTVTLSLDANAQAELTVKRGDRVLKNIPGPIRKNPKVAALTERRADLKRQASRVRQSLETAMLRGDQFTGAELRGLFEHPVIKPLLERLILLGDGKRGYPVDNGAALRDHSGRTEAVGAEEQLRLAHAYDLYAAGDWDRWQHECFASERVQPFKQVFRELYLVTDQERKDGPISHRYTGHQVNPSQAMALFGGRGWTTQDGVSRTFYDAGYTADVSFRYGVGTPMEVEGLTFDAVSFHHRGEWGLVALDQIPPRIFSEVMRDCDLVVSVAHRGGVDPEASASTVEMRSMLVRETCDLLRISNFTLKGAHVLIDGTLGKYSVHLGSGVVHRQPGGSLCIVSVGAQHRGRLFLPFADDDPRTAEVISKVILLARDNEIQDPTILEQLR